MCWGGNALGQLGDNWSCGYTTCPVPVQVLGLTSGVRALTAGIGHTCALMNQGGVKCWGWNGNGQLGDGSEINRPVPTDVSGLAGGVEEIAAGGYHTCARISAGGIKCWGKNRRDQLGDGSGQDQRTPVNVAHLTVPVVAIAGGYNHTCAITNTGGAKCWGRNLNGELGVGQHNCPIQCPFPLDVDGLSSRVLAVSAGGGHVCALVLGGRVKCWGWNIKGQVGDGTTEDQSTPVDVVGLHGWSCIVPKAVGRRVAAARAVIIAAHCTVGQVAKRSSKAKKKGRVIAQSPAAGRNLEFGSKVNLIVGKGRKR